MLDENYIGDLVPPPQYDWYIKINPKSKYIDIDTEKEEPVMVYTTIVLVKNINLDFIENQMILEYRNKKLGIFQGTRKTYKYLLNKRVPIIWNGITEQNIFSKKYILYEEGMENTNDLFYYKSVILKVFK